MEHLNHLITHYGYWAVAVGCLLEGETLLILAGIAARRGLLALPWVLAVGACAGALSDVAFFAVGRWRGRAVLARWPKLESYRNRLDAGLSRWGPGMIVGVRFMYGMRIAGPILLGTTQLPWHRFIGYNALGAVLWAGLVAGAGWLFGHAAERMLQGVEHAEHWAGLFVVVAAAAFGLWHWWRRRQAPKPEAGAAQAGR